jgi:hypothetical protein
MEKINRIRLTFLSTGFIAGVFLASVYCWNGALEHFKDLVVEHADTAQQNGVTIQRCNDEIRRIDYEFNECEFYLAECRFQKD